MTLDNLKISISNILNNNFNLKIIKISYFRENHKYYKKNQYRLIISGFHYLHSLIKLFNDIYQYDVGAQCICESGLGGLREVEYTMINNQPYIEFCEKLEISKEEYDKNYNEKEYWYNIKTY